MNSHHSLRGAESHYISCIILFSCIVLFHCISSIVFYSCTYWILHCIIQSSEVSTSIYYASPPPRRSQGEWGGDFPTPETEKMAVEKWCYFPELYKMTDVQEDGIENVQKGNFPLRF